MRFIATPINQFLDLPIDTLKCILDYLPTWAKVNLAQTCKHFACSISDSDLTYTFEEIRDLSYSGRGRIHDWIDLEDRRLYPCEYEKLSCKTASDTMMFATGAIKNSRRSIMSKMREIGMTYYTISVDTSVVKYVVTDVIDKHANCPMLKAGCQELKHCHGIK